jgi:hypothetical protein
LSEALPRLRSSERTSTTDKQRRVGEFEWDLLRRSALLNGPTDIALTFVDYLGKQNRDARRFDQLDQDALLFMEEVERVAGAQVSLVSTALLDLFEVTGTERQKIESAYRGESVEIEHPTLGKATIRDQAPMHSDAVVARFLDNLTPAQWYRMLNSRVFFGLQRNGWKGSWVLASIAHARTWSWN